MNKLLQSSTAAPPIIGVIGVIGAGTMGAGIAQVAATAGHSVKLMDLREGAALAAIVQIDKVFASLVSKQRMSAEDRVSTLARISAVNSLRDISDAAMVVVKAGAQSSTASRPIVFIPHFMIVPFPDG